MRDCRDWQFFDRPQTLEQPQETDVQHQAFQTSTKECRRQTLCKKYPGVQFWNLEILVSPNLATVAKMTGVHPSLNLYRV